MASPQREHGYTAIANETMEALAKIRIPGEARQMLDVILRKTYGFNKKEDKISTSQFMELTGLDRGRVYRSRRRLKEMNLIAVFQKEVGKIVSYLFQKDYHKWVLSPKKETVYKKGDTVSTKKERGISKKGQQVSPKVTPTITNKSRYTKVDITKERFSHLTDPHFEEVFTAYLQTRKAKATDHAKELLLRDLQREEVGRAILMLEQSIKNGWIGVFKLKEGNNGKHGVNLGQDSSQYSGIEEQVNG